MIVYFRPSGKFLDSSLHRRFDLVGGRQRVRSRQLEDGERNRGIAIEIGIGRVVDGGELDPSHVLETNHRGRALLDHDVGELFRIDQPSERAHRQLEGARLCDRRLIEHARGDLHVLPLQGRRHISGGQAEGLQAIGIEPDAHRVVARPERGDGSDAVDAAEHIGDFGLGVVRDEQRVARLVRGIEVHDHHQVGRALGRGDADIAHVRRDARQRDGDPVLNLHLRGIKVGAEIERHVDRETAVPGRVRRDVEHVLDAVDLLLERSSHRCGDDVGARPGILAADPDHRRGDVRKLRDRHSPERHRADDDEDDRNDGGEDRPVDEEVGEAHRRLRSFNWRRLEDRRPRPRRCSIAAA